MSVTLTPKGWVSAALWHVDATASKSGQMGVWRIPAIASAGAPHVVMASATASPRRPSVSNAVNWLV
jgi:hypothetical protein